MTETEGQKYQALVESIRKLKRAAVAFSGGVDSALLLQAAHEALGDQCIAVTAGSGTFPAWESKEAEEFCKDRGIRQIRVQSDELEKEEFCANPKNRCYICKKALFQKMKDRVKEEGIDCVLEGSNLDDLGDYRPGLQAVKELGILSPLRDCDLTKKEIRSISEALKLPTWKKPSYACLASRFVYGERITPEKLRQVEQAEELLMKLGFEQMRVRIHGNLARIEVLPQDLERLASEETRTVITEAFTEYGFTYVTLDLQGFRSGSMNVDLS